MTENAATNVIKMEMIFLDWDLSDRQQIFSAIAREAKKQKLIKNEASYLQSLQERESEVSTAIGYDIAIPHGKTQAVKEPFIAFMRLKNATKWAADIEDEVRLVFAIGVPEKGAGKLHLKFISQLSRQLLNEEFRNYLLKEESRKAVFEKLSSITL